MPYVHITKSIGTLQNFGINDNKTTITAQGEGVGKEMGVGRVIQSTPPFIKTPLNRSQTTHNELWYNLHIEHKKINKSNNTYKKSKISLPETKNLFSLIMLLHQL